MRRRRDMVNAKMVNADLRVSNTPFSVKFFPFWADSCTAKTRLNISAELMLTKKRCIFIGQPLTASSIFPALSTILPMLTILKYISDIMDALGETDLLRDSERKTARIGLTVTLSEAADAPLSSFRGASART